MVMALVVVVVRPLRRLPLLLDAAAAAAPDGVEQGGAD